MLFWSTSVQPRRVSLRGEATLADSGLYRERWRA
jgi:hypothetical protein